MKYDLPSVLKRLGIEVESTGRMIIGKCPVHRDRHPSWHMRNDGGPKHGLHICRSCGFSGDLVDLVARVKGFGDARGFEADDVCAKVREWLKSDEQAPEPPRAVIVRASAARALAFRLPGEVELGPVESWPTPARAYMLRRCTSAQVARWGFGYAVHGRLESRIVLVVRNQAGAPVSYTARTFVEHPTRYLNPREWEGADKSAVFGVQYWPEIEERSTVWVTEGIINALAVERAVPGACVAGLLGSRIHPRHIAALRTFREVVLVMDPDAAGERAAQKLHAAIGQCRRVVLPSGYDADGLGPELGRYLWSRDVNGNEN